MSTQETAFYLFNENNLQGDQTFRARRMVRLLSSGIRVGFGSRSSRRRKRPAPWPRIAFAWICIVFLDAASQSTLAGVNTWTTSGPRTEWTFISADPRPGGALFVDTLGRSYRSTDQGLYWFPIAVAGLQASELEAYAFDPNVEHRVYAAVDDTGGAGSNTLRIYRSDDDGVSWAPLGNVFAQFGLIGTSIRALRLAVARTDASRIYALASTPYGLSYTSDAGVHWTSIGPRSTQLLDFILDDSTPGTLYGTGIGGTFRSTDNGVTWQLIVDGLPSGFVGTSIAVDPMQPRHLMLLGAVSAASGVFVTTLYHSTDGGSTWAPTSLAATSTVRDGGVVFDTGNSSLIYTRINAQLWRSADGGVTWQPVAFPHDALPLALPTTEQGSVYAATSTLGIVKSDDQGSTWLALNQGLPGGKTRRLGAIAANDFTLLGLVRIQNPADYDTAFRRASSSNLWSKQYAGNRVLGAFGASALNSGRVIASANNAVQGPPGFESDDAGATWQVLPTPGAGFTGIVNAFVFSPASDADVFAIGELIPFVTIGYAPGAFANSHDGGQTWQDQSAVSAVPTIASLTVDPSQPNVIYAGAGIYGSLTIQRSVDGGNRWTTLPLTGVQGSRVSAILVNPRDSQQLVAALGARHSIYASNDAGASWYSIGDGLVNASAVSAVAADWTTTPPTIFAGTDQGVFSAAGPSANMTWTRLPGSEVLSVNDLRIDSGTATARVTLTAATETGVWEYTVDTDSTLEAVYRFYNTQTEAHFYTASADERAHVLATWPQFIYEGIAFYVAKSAEPGSRAVYRFYNTQTGAHFYTASVAERDKIVATLPQYAYEGSVYNAFSDAEPGTVKVYSFYNSQTGTHFYTAQDDERDAVDQHLPQFGAEGIVYNVYPAASQR